MRRVSQSIPRVPRGAVSTGVHEEVNCAFVAQGLKEARRGPVRGTVGDAYQRFAVVALASANETKHGKARKQAGPRTDHQRKRKVQSSPRGMAVPA